MIDPEHRARLGQALSQWVEGAITNDQFAERSQSWECADPAVRSIGEFYVELCTDEREYRLTGSHALDARDRAIADRCRLFLQTNLEYEWPKAPSVALLQAAGGAAVFVILPLGVVLLIAAAVFRDVALLFAGITCFGLSGLWLWAWSHREQSPEWRAYWASGEREVWPFLRRADYELALRQVLRGVAPPDRAANGSQPIGSETSQTPSAGGK